RAVTRDVYVRLNGAFSSLKVTGWQKDSVVMTGSLPRDSRLEPAMGGPSGGAPAPGVKFYIEASTSGAAAGSLELFVPAGATVWAKSGSATIDVTGITGGLDLNIIGGTVTVNGNPRELNIESMDGNVSVAGAPTWMRVKTASGDVTVRGMCTDLAITTVSGTVTVRDGEFERARLESVTGNITFGAGMTRAGTLLIDSHSGTIELQIGKQSLDIDATTITGSITNSVSTRRPTPGREGRGEELTLSLGTGDARATLRSFKGNIRLIR
ncbi:MAG TPA: DUF4097 family beta strand repeat-containing protein, partial [Gemmatimonadaceae bacterium]|nr:DUF4097 family beta strand repeat-containing protein [Gemmatimonadaceae bacterium]